MGKVQNHSQGAIMPFVLKTWQQNVTFNQGVQCLLCKKPCSGIEIHNKLEIMTYDPFICPYVAYCIRYDNQMEALLSM